MQITLRNVVATANRWLDDLNRTLRPGPTTPDEAAEVESDGKTVALSGLRRVVLTDQVNRLILEEFAAHRRSDRGEEEIGWLLLGLRQEREAVVLATLPAGAGRDAGVAHVQFNSTAQAVATRILQQQDRRLTLLGVLHTHPGSLRRPSSGDHRGDSQWVGRLRGKEGIFGIGTADAAGSGLGRNGFRFAYQPEPHQQILDELCLSWYALAEGDRGYRPLEATLTLGPDAARPLRSIWPALEQHADVLERLCLQMKGLRFEVGNLGEPTLAVKIRLAGTKDLLRLLFTREDVRYYVERGGDVISVDPQEAKVDRAVYLVLAEMAGGNQ